MEEFERDATGRFIARPVTRWTVVTAVGTGVILAIRYAETPEELEIGDSRPLQMILTREQSLSLADQLKKHADNVHDPGQETTH